MFWLSLARRNLNDFILITCVLNNWSEHLWTLFFWRKLSEGNSKFVIFEFDVTYFPLNSIFASTIFGHLKRTILNWFDHRLNSERSISKLPHSKKTQNRPNIGYLQQISNTSNASNTLEPCLETRLWNSYTINEPSAIFLTNFLSSRIWALFSKVSYTNWKHINFSNEQNRQLLLCDFLASKWSALIKTCFNFDHIQKNCHE